MASRLDRSGFTIQSSINIQKNYKDHINTNMKQEILQNCFYVCYIIYEARTFFFDWPERHDNYRLVNIQ